MGQLTYTSWSTDNEDFEIDEQYKGALNVLKWAYDHYEDELIYACSFGIEGIVMIDLISRVNPSAKVVFLDTGLHFKETYALINQVKKRYPKLNIEMKKPAITVEQQADKYGDNMWERQPNRCCHIRKVVPLQETLNDAIAWISGVRREQSPSRSKTAFLNKDEVFESVKVCPIIHWTWEEIWNYVDQHQLPYNPLHDQGYPSIGCAPCTQQGDMETGSRSGRWANQSKTECGLHKN